MSYPFKIFFAGILLVTLFCCNDKSNESARGESYEQLEEKVNGLKIRIDSLVETLKPKAPAKSAKSKKKTGVSTKGSASNNNREAEQLSNTANSHTWEQSPQQTPVNPVRQEKKAYSIRIGAICCDGSRSYATGRGACSHHGGVCEWLYQ